MNKGFLKAISDIKKQKQKQALPPKAEQKQEKQERQESISSSEQEKLKALGAYKKKIVKEDKEQNKWKHDRYKENAAKTIQAKPVINQQKYQIKFQGAPGYNKLYPLVKHIKIYIREIDDNHVVFNTAEAYQSALQIYKKADLHFTAL